MPTGVRVMTAAPARVSYISSAATWSGVRSAAGKSSSANVIKRISKSASGRKQVESRHRKRSETDIPFTAFAYARRRTLPAKGW